MCDCEVCVGIVDCVGDLEDVVVLCVVVGWGGGVVVEGGDGEDVGGVVGEGDGVVVYDVGVECG